jgi:hypothetical protein
MERHEASVVEEKEPTKKTKKRRPSMLKQTSSSETR